MKTVYCLRTRPDDGADWSQPKYFQFRKERDRASGYARIWFGIRTWSYEEKMPKHVAVELLSK
jgi:hypothetical protein